MATSFLLKILNYSNLHWTFSNDDDVDDILISSFQYFTLEFRFNCDVISVRTKGSPATTITTTILSLPLTFPSSYYSSDNHSTTILVTTIRLIEFTIIIITTITLVD